MKQKFYVVFAIIILCFVAISAQEKNYEIEILTPETVVAKTAGDIPVTVKIKNYGKKTLRTESLGDVYFYFSKCEVGVVCDKIGDRFWASMRIPSKGIQENATFKFEVNLANLYWKDETDENLSSGNPSNFGIIPSPNNNFYGGIRSLEGYRPIANASGSSGAKKPVYKYKFSNLISITLK